MQKEPFVRLIRNWCLAASLFWTLLISVGGVIICMDNWRDTTEIARSIGLTTLEKNSLIQVLNFLNGNIYTKVSKEHPPSTYLTSLPDRDLFSTDGRQLTMIDPSIIMRHISDGAKGDAQFSLRLTSFNPIHPENAPDPWEMKALSRLAQGSSQSMSELLEVDGKSAMRVMVPLISKESCLGCHKDRASAVGELMGGLTVAVPVEGLLNESRRDITRIILLLSVVYILGLGGLGCFYTQVKKHYLVACRAARAAASEKQNWVETFDAIPDVVAIQDLDFRIEKINEAGAKFFGIPREEVIGKHCYELFRGKNSVCLDCPIDIEFSCNLQKVLHERFGRHFLVSTTSIKDSNSKSVGVVHCAKDITEFRNLQEQYNQAQKMESVGRLAGGVAHDFNNMLSVINGHAELSLMRMEPDDPHRKDLEIIAEAGKRAARLTHRLLAFSRKENANPKDVDLNREIEGLGNMLARLLGEDIRIKNSLAKDLWPVRIDRSHLEQILLNLAVNARDAMPEGGLLHIRTENFAFTPSSLPEHFGMTEGQYVLLAVSDTGEGIEEALCQKIFEPFFTTKSEGKGTGLGLASVYGIVKQSGGDIHVESKPGRGTCFRIYLPRHSKAQNEDVLPDVKKEAKSVPRGTETILLVEDDANVRFLVKSILHSFGYTILEAQNGEEALEQAAAFTDNIDLVLSDLIMPGINGKELALRVKEHFPDVKVLLMSGYTEDTLSGYKIAENGIDFLHKPILPGKLAEKLSEMLG